MLHRPLTLACVAALSTTSACFDPDPPTLGEESSTGTATDPTSASTSSGMVVDTSAAEPDSTSGDTSTSMPCAEVTCDPNATCDDATGEAVCTCNPGWAGDGATCENVDECEEGSSDCDPNATCMDLPGSYACSCNEGFEGDGTSCGDLDECAVDIDGCGPGELCLNEAPGVTCACVPGTSGSPCAPRTILVYSDSGNQAEVAATSLGYTVNPTMNHGAFQAAFDAGGFDLVIYDAPGNGLDAADQMRLTSWVSGGGRLIFGVYNLESFAPMQAALGVSTVSYNSPRPVHLAADAVVSLYAQRESIGSPMTTTDDFVDNGDELTLTGAGTILARLDGPMGPGAMVLTNGHRVVVNGFLPNDIGSADGDGDGTPDMVEMYRNQIDLLMNPRVLSHNEAGPGGPLAAARRMGWPVIPTTTGPSFSAAYDAGLYDIVVIDLPTTMLPTGVRTRLVSGLAGSDRIVLSWWDLESDAPLAAALGVDVTSIGMPLEVHDDPSGVADSFHVFQDVPDPLIPTLDAPGNGFSCAPAGAGSIEAHFESAMGEGAICVTNDGRVVVNGLLPYDFGGADADGDMIPDVEELYENQYYRLMAAPAG